MVFNSIIILILLERDCFQSSLKLLDTWQTDQVYYNVMNLEMNFKLTWRFY